MHAVIIKPTPKTNKKAKNTKTPLQKATIYQSLQLFLYTKMNDRQVDE